ncbi:hypothetical protein MTP99_005814 [Tenebrio molitor]|nr:hypothetical protein MTP99_005814 [Tenebrio molitor]
MFCGKLDILFRGVNWSQHQRSPCDGNFSVKKVFKLSKYESDPSSSQLAPMAQGETKLFTSSALVVWANEVGVGFEFAQA